LFGRDGQTLNQQTLNQLCEQFPEMTRFGVMKHLSLLAEANLVITARHGRGKRHYLNPAPIEEAANRRISKYAARFTSAPVALDDQVIADHETETLRGADRHEPACARLPDPHRRYTPARVGGDHRVRVDSALLPHTFIRRTSAARQGLPYGWRRRSASDRGHRRNARQNAGACWC
jgi:hypothetical protein